MLVLSLIINIIINDVLLFKLIVIDIHLNCYNILFKDFK